MCAIAQHIRPSGSVNKIRGPKKVILASSGNGWVEWSPLVGCPSFEKLSKVSIVCSLSVILFMQNV